MQTVKTKEGGSVLPLLRENWKAILRTFVLWAATIAPIVQFSYWLVHVQTTNGLLNGSAQEAVYKYLLYMAGWWLFFVRLAGDAATVGLHQLPAYHIQTVIIWICFLATAIYFPVRVVGNECLSAGAKAIWILSLICGALLLLPIPSGAYLIYKTWIDRKRQRQVQGQ